MCPRMAGNVRRWTSAKRLKGVGQPSECILDLERWIIPVHLGNHWTCALVDLAARGLTYFDSYHVRLYMGIVQKHVIDTIPHARAGGPGRAASPASLAIMSAPSMYMTPLRAQGEEREIVGALHMSVRNKIQGQATAGAPLRVHHEGQLLRTQGEERDILGASRICVRNKSWTSHSRI